MLARRSKLDKATCGLPSLRHLNQRVRALVLARIDGQLDRELQCVLARGRSGRRGACFAWPHRDKLSRTYVNSRTVFRARAANNLRDFSNLCAFKSRLPDYFDEKAKRYGYSAG